MIERAEVDAGQTVGGDANAGSFSADFVLCSPDGKQRFCLTGLVDTRRPYTIVPRETLEALGVKREHYQRFRREDGFVRNLGVGFVKMELQGKMGSAHIVFGDDCHETIIGSLALARFGLAADPARQELIPGLLRL